MKQKRESSKSPSWNQLKHQLREVPSAKLLEVIRDLYRLSSENRRFLEARFLSSNDMIERYRQLVSKAVNPDPFSRRPVSIAEAKQLIREYEQATQDPIGITDLRLTFVEQGTNQALELGYGDEKYFASLASTLNLALESMQYLPSGARQQYLPRLTDLRDRGSQLGWGYGDFLWELIEQTILEMDEEV
jgi:hypothetical protein